MQIYESPVFNILSTALVPMVGSHCYLFSELTGFKAVVKGTERVKLIWQPKVKSAESLIEER